MLNWYCRSITHRPSSAHDVQERESLRGQLADREMRLRTHEQLSESLKAELRSLQSHLVALEGQVAASRADAERAAAAQRALQAQAAEAAVAAAASPPPQSPTPSRSSDGSASALQRELAAAQQQLSVYVKQCQALSTRVAELSDLDRDRLQRIGDLSRELAAAREGGQGGGATQSMHFLELRALHWEPIDPGAAPVHALQQTAFLLCSFPRCVTILHYSLFHLARWLAPAEVERCKADLQRAGDALEALNSQKQDLARQVEQMRLVNSRLSAELDGAEEEAARRNQALEGQAQDLAGQLEALEGSAKVRPRTAGPPLCQRMALHDYTTTTAHLAHEMALSYTLSKYDSIAIRFRCAGQPAGTAVDGRQGRRLQAVRAAQFA